jgi:hypothetical protein
MLCQDRDLQAINAEKRQFGGMMEAEINNIIKMELYSRPKMAHGKYEKTNVAGSIDRDSTAMDILHVSIKISSLPLTLCTINPNPSAPRLNCMQHNPSLEADSSPLSLS